MNLLKRIGLWIIFSLLILLALGSIPSFACFMAIIIASLIIPIEKWQNLLQKFIKGKIKTIVIIILTVLMFVTLPNVDTEDNTNTPNETTAISSNTEATTNSTTAPTTIPTTETTTAPSTENTTVPTTELNTEPVTEPATEPTHTHNFKDATCTKPKTCSCGVTEGEAKGHSWKAATCKAPKTCKTCGETNGDVAEHSWKAATCKAPKTCKTCGKTTGSKNSHNYVSGKCSYCGKANSTTPTNKPSSSTSDGDPDNDDTGGETVYKTPTGKRYHVDPNCGGKNSTKTTLAKAVKAGLTPCKTCVK